MRATFLEHELHLRDDKSVRLGIESERPQNNPTGANPVQQGRSAIVSESCIVSSNVSMKRRQRLPKVCGKPRKRVDAEVLVLCKTRTTSNWR